MTQNEAMERAKERWNANLLSDDRVRNKIAQREHRKEEAKRLVDKYGGYGGRRILGVDSNGNNIQVSFWATHDSFEIKQSHDDLRRFTFERDGRPAATRMQLFKTATNPKELELLKEPLDERSDAVRSMRRKTGFSTDMTAYWIQANCDFDQLILEFYKKDDPAGGWVHVSYNEKGANRKQVLTYDGKTYENGLPDMKWSGGKVVG